MVTNGKDKIALLAVMIMLLSAGMTRAEEKPDKKNSRHPDELYMLNYSKFVQYGFYLSVSAQAAQFSGGWGALFGQRAALVVDHIFAIGAAYEISLYTDRNRVSMKRNSSDRMISRFIARNDPRILYGGGYISYHIFHDWIVNFSLGALGGWGHIGKNYAGGDGSTFAFVEPEVYVFVNLPWYVRLGVGASYRFSWGVKYQGIKDRDFWGFSIGFQIQAGVF